MGTIALSTWSLLPRMGYRHAIDFAIAHRFEGIELWSNPLDFWPGAVAGGEVDVIRRAAHDHHLSLAIHFCYGSNNLADYHDGHRAVCLAQLQETIALASRLGAEIVVIHPGTIPDFLPVHMKDDLNPRLSLSHLKLEAIERFKGSLRTAVPWAEAAGVTLALENLGYRQYSIQSTHQDLANWVDEIGSPALKVALDVGHANLEQGLEKAITTLGPRVCHVHLDDNDGKASKHGELGTGSIDWNANAPFLRSFSGMLSLEIRNDEDTEGAVLRSKAFIERLLSGD